MKVLFLISADYWHRKMSLGRTAYAEAMMRLPGVELRVSGNKFPEYDSRQSLDQNIARWGWRPDAVWSYKPQDHIGVPEFDGVRLVTFNEANGPKTLEEIRACNANLLVFHHHNDIARWRHLGIECVHVPHGAPEDIFRSQTPLQARPVDCLLSGVISDVYPLRSRLRNLVTSGVIPGTVRNHPGYRLGVRPQLRGQWLDYAADLSRAKISLCCTSTYQYSLAKIVESMMAGCVVATDRADDPWFVEHLWPHCIKLHRDMGDEQVAGIINEWLSMPDDLQKRASRGQQVVMERFKASDVASSIAGAIESMELSAA